MDRIRKIASGEIEKRHWGTRAPGRSPGGAPRLYILDIRGLFLAAGVLRYTLHSHGCGLLYRGQSRDWDLRCALLRGAADKHAVSDRLTWLSKALAEITRVFDPTGTADEREALAQHYGLPTIWLDLVDHLQTAAWFAYHRPDGDSQGRDDAVGYIYAIAHPLGTNDEATAIDLRLKPSEWLRPHVQQAWSIRTKAPSKELGRLTHLHVCTFVVPRPLLGDWSAYSAISESVMLPNEHEDSGLRYWHRAEDALKAKGLLPVPW